MTTGYNRPTTVLESIRLECVLFLDIETVPMESDFEELPDRFKPLWLDKARKYSNEGMMPEDLFFDKGGIHAEFGKIICISVGYFHINKQTGSTDLRIKSFSGDDEKELLINFKALLDAHYNDCTKHYLCAHNGIEFDFPFLARRMMIHRMRLPAMLNISGSKSWSNRWLIDTMDLWRFGDYKEKTSLNLMAACFGIESPKDDISGKDVAKVYYREHDLERIRTYCQKDVATLAKLFLCFVDSAPIMEEDVIFL